VFTTFLTNKVTNFAFDLIKEIQKIEIIILKNYENTDTILTIQMIIDGKIITFDLKRNY
jgi:hypothetical protein